MLAVHTVTADRAGGELSVVSAVLLLPFLLFPGYAGQLADVYSKRRVLVVSKSDFLDLVVRTARFDAQHTMSARLPATIHTRNPRSPRNPADALSPRHPQKDSPRFRQPGANLPP